MSDENTKPIKKEKDSKPKKKKRRGFAGVLWGQVGKLNDSDYFKDKYGQDNYKFLLIATDDRYAGLMTVENGSVDVDAIKNKPPVNPKEFEWDGMLRCDTEKFFALAQGKLSTLDLLKMVLKGQIKGIKPMLQLAKYFNVVGYMMKQEIKEIRKAKEEQE